MFNGKVGKRMSNEYLKNKNILLVDDEEDILEFVSYNLKLEGWEVQTATNGLDAIKMAKF